MIKLNKIAALAGAALLALGTTEKASAAFAAGDLILSFQATSGIGSGLTYMVNLGAGYTYRDATSNITNIATIGTALDSIYGLTAGNGVAWHGRSDLYWNIVGVRASGYSPGNPTVLNGDTRSTIYASRARSSEATNASLYDFAGGSSLDSPAVIITGYNTTAGTALASANAASYATSNINTIEDYTTPVGPTTNNFGLFSNDFSQSFAVDVGAFQGILDIQRLNRTNTTSGAHAGNVVVSGVNAGDGSFEGSLTIDTNGQLNYYNAIPEPSTYALLVAALGAVAFLRRRAQKA